MKVAVITRHAVANYGSLLQAIATQKVIEELGHSCEIIDYVREDEDYRQVEKSLLKRKPRWDSNPVKRGLYLALRQPESLLAGRKFEKEQKKYLNMTRRYTSQEELRTDKPGADVYLTGSDQVWGPVVDGTYDSTYCLSFTEESEKRISYGASFGHTDMTERVSAYYRKWLSRYNHIAVREDSAVDTVKDLGMEALQVLDPTLLMDAGQWAEYMQAIPRGKYVLVYQLHNDKRLGEYAKRVAKAKKLPLLRISVSFHQISREGKFIWAPKLGEFLSYIKHADCMVTDSFHGTAFAINFNTPFVEVLPNNNTGTRNMSILRLTGLSDRILEDDENVDLAGQTIDFRSANEILAGKRTESLELLKKMIEA